MHPVTRGTRHTGQYDRLCLTWKVSIRASRLMLPVTRGNMTGFAKRNKYRYA